MSLELKKIAGYEAPKGPVVLVIMDGVGIGKYEEGDFVRSAAMPTLDGLKAKAQVVTQLKAHGRAVGMPSDADMGNSEIGHNAIGCGRVYDQGAALVGKAVASGSLFEGATWKGLVANVRETGGTLHFIGLLSDGNVHSHIDHLKGMLQRAQEEGVARVRIHALIDGRDVPPTSALDYVGPFEEFLAGLNAAGGDFAIASGGGRMNITMDRYEANWDMVARGWACHVKGEGRQFASAKEAIETYRAENPGVLDQDLPAFVVAKDGEPLGRIVDGDSVVLFNFRGDRAIELTRAFEAEAFDKFARGPRPKVKFAGMMQYDGDAGIPKSFLVEPPRITRTIGEYLADAGVRQLAISETQKFGHVTYFFNGNRAEKFSEELEDYVEVPSDIVPFEERPWMKSAEITDKLLEAVAGGKYRFIRVNYPNGDMVGHTGVFDAVHVAMEAVDLALARLSAAVEKAGGVLVVSADHGNSDDMYEHAKDGSVKLGADGKPKARTAHSLNPVPAVVWAPAAGGAVRPAANLEGLGISSLAATCLNLLGYETPEGYDPSLVEVGG